MAYIYQLGIVPFYSKTLVYGTVLKGSHDPADNPHGTVANFFAVIGSYFQKPYANRKVLVKTSEKTYEITTDEKGGFHCLLDTLITEPVSFSNNDGSDIPVPQEYPVLFNHENPKISVISDVDDTILVSYTRNIYKRVKTMLFRSPRRRKSISFTLRILREVAQREGRVYYVSKSEGNLFIMISSFFMNHEVPNGALFLTPYLRYSQLLNPNKGKFYKEQRISEIIENSPGQHFVLMGDDTQQDIMVYEKISRKFPEQVLKIYIRKTLRELSPSKSEELEKLDASPVPVHYFSDTDDPEDEIKVLDNI
ncbi:phosphatase domain-containing protein [Robertkochia aurantiaca]|uniref:phosphatase domain-containing protein n=1 Tax=Robertkochia aurantiaca TaxID=2873700 RepID=UPI001CCC7C0D|nr:phosphatase domain-containing protein [Robertkochia sp. 3YJGBD-33]